MISCLHFRNAQITYYMFIDDEPKNEKNIGRCVGCWKLQHQELLVIDPVQIRRLGASLHWQGIWPLRCRCWRLLWHCFLATSSNHYIKHIQYIQIITELHSSNLSKNSSKLVGMLWRDIGHGNATQIMSSDATNDFSLARDASGNPGDGGNPGELTAAFHRQSMTTQYK